MKFKYAVITMCLIALVMNAFAQENTGKTNRNEVRISYGFLTMPETANSLMSLWTAIGINISMDTVTDYNSSFHGIATLEYNRFLNKWLTLGGSMSINPINTIIKTKSDLTLTWSYYVFNVMPKVNFYYLNKDMVSLYSGAEIGITAIMWSDRQGSTTKNDLGVAAAFHLNMFGIRVGKQIGGFMEWGFGYRGVVNFGVSAKL